MTSKKYLSNKKTTKITFSTSDALKEWIERYVRVKARENPEDERYKSVSAFCHHTLEEVLTLFEDGKSLDDFDHRMDNVINDFYDKLSVSLYIPLLEPYVIPSKYIKPNFKSAMSYYITFRRFFLSLADPYDMKSVNKAFGRIRKRYINNKITKELHLDLFTIDGSKQYRGIIEHMGKPLEGFPTQNLHFFNYKAFAASLGFLGLKITNVDYSEEELYYRLDVITTDLFFQKDLNKRERIKLLNYNVNFVVNYNEILDDLPLYLWMDMSEDEGIIVAFRNERVGRRWIKNIEEELKKFGTIKELSLKLLRFFEKLHWIELNELDPSFRFLLPEHTHQKERQLVIETLSKHYSLEEEDGSYYCEKN